MGQYCLTTKQNYTECKKITLSVKKNTLGVKNYTGCIITQFFAFIVVWCKCLICGMLKTLNPNKTHSDRGLGRGSNGFGQILPLVILFVLSALAAYGKDKQYVATC